MIIPNNNGEVEYYYCEPCNFRCRKLSNYNVHLFTNKHQNLSNGNITNNTNVKNNKKYTCSCGKIYKHASSLSFHKKNCINKNNENNNSEIDYEELYLKALKNNKEKICFKKLYLKLNIDLDTDL